MQLINADDTTEKRILGTDFATGTRKPRPLARV